MKVDVKTLDGETMTAKAATLPVGTALRICPAFLATSTDPETGVETTVEAHYNADAGRYISRTIVSRATAGEFDEYLLRHAPVPTILQAAVPHCISIQLFDEPGGAWVTVADLTAREGRIVPPWLAAAVVKHGAKEGRLEVIEILYGASALAGQPPAKAISIELDVPQRTASDWIARARAAGRLQGMKYTVGRQADG